MAYTVGSLSTLELTFEANHNNQVVMNVFHYRFVSGTLIQNGRAALESFIAAIQGAGKLYPVWRSCISQELTNMKIYAQWLHPTRYAYVEAFGVPDMGAVQGTALPQNCAAAVTKLGDRANRHNVGTVHMPGVPLDWADAGFLTQNGLNTYITFKNQLSVAVILPTGQEMAPVIYDRSNPGSSVIVVDGDVQETLRVMRRRTVGLGI